MGSSSNFLPPQLPGQCPCICKTQPLQPSSCNCSVSSSAEMKSICLFLLFSLAFLRASSKVVPHSDSGLPRIAGPECDRSCHKHHSEPLHCIFNWRIVNHFINCLGDTDGCYGDGIPRHVTLVDDYEDDVLAIPGPAIAVCHGDEVSVNVVNELESESSTIHWHGLPMR